MWVVISIGYARRSKPVGWMPSGYQLQTCQQTALPRHYPRKSTRSLLSSFIFWSLALLKMSLWQWMINRSQQMSVVDTIRTLLIVQSKCLWLLWDELNDEYNTERLGRPGTLSSKLMGIWNRTNKDSHSASRKRENVWLTSADLRRIINGVKAVITQYNIHPFKSDTDQVRYHGDRGKPSQ